LASRLGLSYDELVLQPDVVDLLPKLVWHLDEPLADPAVIPAYLVSQRAARHAKVVLSGMGADELFGGYRRHLVEPLLQAYGRLPGPIQRTLAAGIRALPSGGAWPLVASARHAKKLVRIAQFPPGERYIQSCIWMDGPGRSSLYSREVRQITQRSQAEKRHREALDEIRSAEPVTQMLYLDTRMYLPGHNLNYTDKMSMAASVEVRVPFLDNDLADFAFHLPASYKVHGLQGKYILKRALKGIVPDAIISRSKTGFAAPIRSWIVNDLQEMVGDLLSPRAIRGRGLFEPQAIAALTVGQHKGQEDHSYQIWALLTLELWMQGVLDKSHAHSLSAA
jgi:asparagine synthase (glutamine-hydrolysing)